MEKHIESLSKAVKCIRIADHLLYVTYPVIKDKRLLLKALEEVYNATINIINSILQYDFQRKIITLTKDSRQNFEIFITKSSKRYNITSEEIREITDIVSLMENHKKSPMEFTRLNKIVIMSDSLKIASIDSEKLKRYLSLAKNMVNKARFGMSI